MIVDTVGRLVLPASQVEPSLGAQVSLPQRQTRRNDREEIFSLTALAAALSALPLLGARAYHAGEAPWRAALAFAAAGAAAGLLAAPQLLPALELLSRSCRALGSVIESQAIFVAPPHDPARRGRGLACTH